MKTEINNRFALKELFVLTTGIACVLSCFQDDFVDFAIFEGLCAPTLFAALIRTLCYSSTRSASQPGFIFWISLGVFLAGLVSGIGIFVGGTFFGVTFPPGRAANRTLFRMIAAGALVGVTTHLMLKCRHERYYRSRKTKA